MKKYNTIVIDPPWPIEMQGKYNRRPNRATKLPYRTMSMEEIMQFKIEKFAEKGAHIYLWTTNKLLPEALKIMEKWRVKYHMTIPYVKTNGMCIANGYKSAVELCLLGFYGKPMKRWAGIAELNWIKGSIRPGKHSLKPAEFYYKVKKMSPGPRIDLFSRQDHNGFKSWGNEKGKYNENT